MLSLILIFLFLIISHTFRNLASFVFAIRDVFVVLEITKLPALLQLLSFTLHWTTCNYLYLNINSQQLVLLQKFQNSITLLLILNRFTGSK